MDIFDNTLKSLKINLYSGQIKQTNEQIQDLIQQYEDNNLDSEQKIQLLMFQAELSAYSSKYQEAITYATQAEKIFNESQLKPPEQNFLKNKILITLGMTHGYSCNFEKSLKYLNEALQSIAKQFPVNKYDQALAYLELGRTLRKYGDVKKSTEYYTKVIEYFEECPKNKINTYYLLIALIEKGCNLRYTNREEEAWKFIEKGDEILKDVFSENYNTHFQRSKILEQFAIMMPSRSQYKEAENFINEAVSIALSEFGENHSIVVSLKNIQFFVSQVLGQPNCIQAQHVEKAYEIVENIFGDLNTSMHLDIINTLRNMAFVKLYQKDYESSLKYADQAIEMAIKLFGEDNLNTAMALDAKAMILQQQSKFDQNTELIDRIIQILRKVGESEDDSGFLALLYERCATNFGCLRKVDQCLEYSDKAFKIWKNLYGENSNHTALNYYFRAYSHFLEKKQFQALEYLDRAEEMLKKSDHVDSKNFYKICAMRADIYQQLGDFQQAKEFYRKAIEKSTELIGVVGDAALWFERLGLCQYNLAEYQNCTDNLHRAKEISEQFIGPQNKNLSSILRSLGLCYVQQGKYEDGMKCLDQALDIGQKAKVSEQEIGYIYSDITKTYQIGSKEIFYFLY